MQETSMAANLRPQRSPHVVTPYAPNCTPLGSDGPDVTSLPAAGAEPIVERGEHILNSGQPMACVRMVENLG